MTYASKGSSELQRIYNILKNLSMEFDPDLASKAYPQFPNFAAHLAKLFIDDRLFDIMQRLETQVKIVFKYNPSIRPALDPYISTQIGIFSKEISDFEIGHFLNYPDCCIKSFSEEIRYGLDEKHRSEMKPNGEVFVTTAGFIPHSIYCDEAISKGLVGFIPKSSVANLKKLEKELAILLPHCHSEYQEHYYEFMGE
ncbi:MAG: DUF483 domain-containing protein [Candidatus Methanomethylicus sp.]|nr:DUF483 domain-containing protein [Candidatus Methanomethylicus sp.]